MNKIDSAIEEGFKAVDKLTAKHTPGPWETVQHGDFLDVIRQGMDGYGDICRIENADCDPPALRAIAVADSQLIAAAPQLKELLRYGVCGYCPSCGCDVGNTAGCQWCNWIQNGRAVLAEIDGETYKHPPALPADEINKRNCAFAAASELLEALESLLGYLRTFWPDEPLFSANERTQSLPVCDAEAAIAKAKGL